MARLIDADAILKKAKPMEELDGDGIPCEVMAVSAILIDDAPTVDAVEVVRCRECKFGTHFGDLEDEWINCGKLHGEPLMPYDGFCSYGERYGEYECSVCHGEDSDCSDYYGTHVVTEQDFCPNCGAKMDLEV